MNKLLLRLLLIMGLLSTFHAATIPSALQSLVSSATTCPITIGGICSKVVPVINFVSTNSLTQGASYRIGSPSGNMLLYLKGTGLSADSAATEVLIGGKTCTIEPMYTSVLQIACRVPASSSFGIQNITVTISSQKATCDPSVCYFQYDLSQAPILTYLVPNVINPNTNIAFGGVLRTQTSSSIQLTIDNYFCNLNVVGSQTYSPDTLDFGSCNIGPLPAGNYNAALTVSAKGAAFQVNTAYNKADDKGNVYNMTILPQVSSLNSHQGTTSGQVLTILGSGFSNFPSENEVFYGETPCVVLSSEYNSIQCNLIKPAVINQTGLQPGHAGLRRRTFAAKASLQVLQQSQEFTTNGGTKTVLLSAETDYNRSPDFSEVLEGFFRAPATGTYQFMISAGGAAQLYLSSEPLSKDNLTLIAQVQVRTGLRDFYDPSEPNQVSQSIQLTEGQHYYLQAIHLGVGEEHLTIGVITPNQARQQQVNSPKKVLSIKINADVVKQTGTLKIKKSLLPIQFAVRKLTSILKGLGFNFPGTNAQVITELASVGLPVNILNKTLIGLGGIVVTDPLLAVEVHYSVEFVNTSSLTTTTKPLGYPSGYVEVTLDNTPTPLLKGAFQVGLGASTATINYDETSDSLRNILLGLPGVGIPRITRHGDPFVGCEWIVQFDGNSCGDLPLLQIASQGTLAGGLSGSLSLDITVLQDCDSNNNRLIFAPIPYDMLFTAETVPQITVQTSGFLASCLDSQCDYTVQQAVVPTVINFDLQGTVLEIYLQNGENLSVEDFNVFFADVMCQVTSYDAQAQKIVAEVSTNDSGDLMVVAGIHIPQVIVDSVEILDVSQVVVGMTFLPSITQVEVYTQAIKDGFLGFSLTGTGFGYCMDNQYGITVEVGGVECGIIALTNEWVFCITGVIVPSGLINLTVNNISTNYTLNFGGDNNTPQELEIVDMEINSDSGEVTLVLNGENFDNTTNVAVLNNQTGASITCSICSYTSTSLTCLTPSLAPGNYSVIANTYLPPDSVSQLTTTITITLEITSISPQYGSQFGGTVITITGQGFSTILNDNQVSFGHLNYVCDVFDANETTIMCTTTPNTYSSEGPQTFAVLQRLEYIAQCNGDCSFYFSNQYTPTISSLDHTNVLAGDHLIIYGTNFSATTEITIADVLADVVSVSPNEIVVEVPEIAAGANLNVSAYDPVLGNFYIPAGLTVSHTLQVTDYSPKIGSLAGTILTITGKGFCDTALVTVGGKSCQILTLSTSTVTCKTTAGSQGAVVVKQDTYQVTANTSYANQQAYTPVITSIANIPTTAASQFSLTFQGQALNLSSSVSVHLQSAQLSYVAQITSANANTIQASFTEVSAGNYNLTVQIGAFIAQFANSSNFNGSVSLAMSIDAVTMVTTSFAGGVELELTGAGFNNDSDVLSVNIEGFECAITSAAFDQVSCVIPPLITANTQTAYQFGQEAILYGTYFSNASNENPQAVFDNTTVTYFKANSSVPNCAFGVDLGEGLIAQLTQIQYFPKAGIDTSTLAGSVFEGSVDGSLYFPIHVLEANIYEGWNIIASPMDNQTATGFRYIRFRRDIATSKCEIAEVRVKGILLSSLIPINSQAVQASATISINGQTSVISNAVEYRADNTPIVSGISPTNGSSKGNTVLHISGTNLADTTEVKIDDIICDITSVAATEIICTTRGLPPISERPNRVTGVINVMADGKGKAISTGVNFLYAERWSDIDTWGCGGFPKEYDSVHIETGMNLLIDVSPPRLVAVIVEGALIFEDADINFQAEYVLIRNGFLQIGTENQPIQSKINITLCGDKANPQLPIFGDKVIGLYEGTVDIHGAQRDVSTTLAQTAVNGASTIQLTDAVDWQVGERIAISSTSYDASHTEERTIVSISGTTIGLDSPLQHTHLVRTTSSVGDDTYEINAEVILLSRNIMIQGDVNSDAKSYGAHLLFYDPGTESTIVRISYTEITKAGQAGFLGRFPINFQHAGPQMSSYVRGNSIHHTYQRGIQIQGTDYLTVQNNALYAVQGYGINLEDGIERFNVIKDNIVLSCRSTLQYLSTQENAIGIRISNPTNFLTGNKVIANPSFGYWFDLKSNSAGAYASSKMCPNGERLGAFENNTASWNTYGIKFDNYLPRTYPCKQTQYTNQPNPFLMNPPVPAVFRNNYLIGNSYKGVEASYVSSVVFHGLRVIESGFAGIDIIFADESPINGTVISNSVFVGSTIPGSSNVNYRGIRLTRSEGLFIQNTIFVNFTASKPAMEIDSMYYNMYYYDSGARTVFVSGLSFINVTQRTNFYNSSTHIIRDLDGSLTDIVGGGTVVSDLPHLNGILGCSSNSTVFGGLVCNSSTEFRRIVFYSVVPATLLGLDLKVLRLDNNTTINETLLANSNYTSLAYRYGRAPVQSYALPFGVGHEYKVFFEGNNDFTNITFELSPHWVSTDASLTLKFNHTAPRETYDLTTWDRILGYTSIQNSTSLWNISDAHGGISNLFGAWYHNVTEEALYVNVIGGNGTKAMIAGYSCRLNCPAATGSGVPKVKVYWSNHTIWPGQVLPQAGDNVVVPWNWTLILDINPPALSTVEIQGDLVFDDTRGENIFSAERIWVRGSLVIGTEDQPFGQKATIILTGTRNDNNLLINSQVDAGTKVLGVTGELLIYGKVVTEKVSLVETVYPGNRTIRTTGNITGWHAGNFIAITSSHSDAIYEIFEIVSCDGENITVTASAQYIHYSGALTSSENGSGYQVDLSSEVILLDRSIQIQGSNQGNWGARVLVTEEYHDTYTQTGRAVIQYASFAYCGQFASKACLSFEMMSNSSQDKPTMITGTVMTESLAWAVKFVQSQNIIFTENIILKADQFGIFFDEGNYQISIVDNRIYNVALDSTRVYAYLSGVSSGVYVGDLASNDLAIQENTVAGCDIGYILKASECGSDNPYVNNVAHSSNTGFIFVTDANVCAEISDLTAYRTDFGVISYFSASKILAHNLILAENNISINLNAVGQDGTNKLITIKDSLFAAFSSLDCVDCYSLTGSCQNKAAIMLGVATYDGKQMPPRVQDRPWNMIWSSATFDSEQVFTNNTFVNFQDGLLPQCYGNYILKTNQYAADYTPVATFNSTQVFRVSNQSLAYFEVPIAEERCGNTACTGLNNVLIQDRDGSLLGNKGSIIPNNPGVIVNTTCTLVHSGNNYYICKNDTLSILQFESLDADKTTRVISPVNISSSNGFSNILNAFKAHDYMTNHLYTRLARFASIIQTNNSYDIQFSGTVPANLQFEIDGSQSSDYAILKVYFFEPKVVSIVNAFTNAYIQPVPSQFNTSAAIASSDPCGTNFYNSTENTINFKITAEPTCKLYIKKTNVLAVNIRYDMTPDQFFQQGGSVRFIDKVASILQISHSSIRVISVTKGSVILDIEIIGANQDTTQNTVATTELDSYATLLDQAYANGDLGVYGTAGILNFSHKKVLIVDDRQSSPETVEASHRSGLVIGLVIGGLTVALLGVGYLAYRYRKRLLKAKAMAKISPEPKDPENIKNRFKLIENHSSRNLSRKNSGDANDDMVIMDFDNNLNAKRSGSDETNKNLSYESPDTVLVKKGVSLTGGTTLTIDDDKKSVFGYSERRTVKKSKFGDGGNGDGHIFDDDVENIDI